MAVAEAGSKPKLRGFSGVSLDRIQSFSDGVFAVAITLLILDVRLPIVPLGKTNNSVVAHALWKQYPHYLAYLISFLVIGAFWMGHHRFFDRLARHDETFAWLNVLYLMSVVFIPFPTSVLSEYGETRVAVVFYASAIVVCGLLSFVMGLYASWQGRLLRDDVAKRDFREGQIHNITYVAVFAVSIGIAFVDIDLAKYFWLALIPLNILTGHIMAGRYGTEDSGT